MSNSNKWKQLQKQAIWDNAVKPLCSMVNGTRNYIERILSISLGKERVNEIMEKIDYGIIVNATEMGIAIEQCELGQWAKNNINVARQERIDE